MTRDHLHPTPSWYCLTTAPQLEFRAETELTARGYRVFVPHEERELRARYSAAAGAVPDRRWRKVPLLARYVFVALEHESDLGSLIYTMSRGSRRIVTGYLGNNGKPGRIAETDVQFLETVSGKRVSISTEPRPLRVGDVGRITSGPLAGQSSTITGIRGERAKMILRVLGGMREIDVPCRSIEVQNTVKRRA